MVNTVKLFWSEGFSMYTVSRNIESYSSYTKSKTLHNIIATGCSLENALCGKCTSVTYHTFIFLGEKKNVLYFQASLFEKSFICDSFSFIPRP